MRASSLPKVVSDRIASLRLGEHLCLFYNTIDEQLAIVAPYLADGLTAHERCLYVADPDTLDRMRETLTAANVDVEAHTDRGALVLLTDEQAYLPRKRFDVNGMMSMLQETVDCTREAGFHGLRAAGDMSWLLKQAPGSEDAIIYEALLTQFYAGAPAIGLCLYDRRRLDPGILEGALGTHPVVVMGEGCCDRNPFFEARNGHALEAMDPRARFAWKLRQLVARMGISTGQAISPSAA